MNCLILTARVGMNFLNPSGLTRTSFAMRPTTLADTPTRPSRLSAGGT